MNYDREFILDMFLDDSVSTINRLIVATADVVNENEENVCFTSRALTNEHNNLVPQLISLRKLKKKSVRFEKECFYEEIVNNSPEDEYLSYFKMRRSTVKALVNFLGEYGSKSYTSSLPLDKRVHVFLYVATGSNTYDEVGAMFGLNKSSVGYIFHEIISLLCEYTSRVINWPSYEEQKVTRMKVCSKYGFPNCVGFIDACRFKIGPSRSKKKKELVLLQAVCNENLMFIDIYVGDIGITKKHEVFNDSPLAHKLKNSVNYENHILGDVEYKLKKNLITPYNNYDLMMRNDARKFNDIHWDSMSYIGNAFQVLKERFLKLNDIDIKSDAVKNFICAVCVVHNFVIIHEGNPHMDEESLNNNGVSIADNLVRTASQKREFLCNYINFIDDS